MMKITIGVLLASMLILNPANAYEENMIDGAKLYEYKTFENESIGGIRVLVTDDEEYLCILVDSIKLNYVDIKCFLKEGKLNEKID